MSHLIVALPVCHKDFDLVMRNLDRCIKLDGTTKHHAIVAYDDLFDPEKASEVVTKARQYFKAVSPFKYGAPYGNGAWPHPQNHCWQWVARHMETLSGSATCWLFWEADAHPLKPGFLDVFEEAYRKGKRPFMGHVVESRGHMNGVALYPFDVSKYSTDAFLVKSVPFDVQLSRSLRIGRPDSFVSVRNDLIEHIVKRHGGDAPLAIGPTVKVSDTAVLCHGVAYVEETNGVTESVPMVEELPFQEQTKWPCGIYELSGNTKTTYFNPSLIEFKGRRFLFSRRSRWFNPNVTKEAQNDLAIFDITEGIPKLLPIPKLTPFLAGEQWDDPRAIVVDGKVYVSFAKWFHRLNRFSYQSLMLLSEDWSSLSVFSEPRFGGNGSEKRAGTGHEKNWVWFVQDRRWYCVYMTNPMTVYMEAELGKRPKAINNKHVVLPWNFGNPYGGTPPILVGNEYLTFFHSWTPWITPRRRYHMGAVTFDSKPPFSLKRITVKPLLSGSENDPRIYGGPPCIFPCGALLQDGQWLVTFGVNDENCGWIKIPKSELDALMVPIK